MCYLSRKNQLNFFKIYIYIARSFCPAVLESRDILRTLLSCAGREYNKYVDRECCCSERYVKGLCWADTSWKNLFSLISSKSLLCPTLLVEMGANPPLILCCPLWVFRALPGWGFLWGHRSAAMCHCRPTSAKLLEIHGKLYTHLRLCLGLFRLSSEPVTIDQLLNFMKF